MARPRNTDRRRQQIVEGLLGLMAERGYEKTSVAEVARAAGLTPGLVHYHFKSKQELLLQAIAHLGSQLSERLAAKLERVGDDPRARLRAFVDAHLARGREADPRAVACWVAVAAEAVRQPEVGDAFRSFLEVQLELLVGLVREALRSSGQPTRSARSTAAAVLAAIEGYFMLASAAPGLVPEGSAAPSVQRLVDALLAG